MESLIKVIRTVNQLRDEGVIGKYYIGGAVGATFYIEPVMTRDVDIFINYRSNPSALLVVEPPFRDRLKQLGYSEYGPDGSVIVEGWPIQFLPIANELERETLEHAISLPVDEDEKVMAEVPQPEYLMAIALKTGRMKDKMRIKAFLDEGCYEEAELFSLLDRFAIRDCWEKWRRELSSEC